MKKRFTWIFSLVLAVMLLIPVFVCAEGSNPIETNIEISPKTLTGAGSVRVNISVSNVMDDAQTVSVTLYDPNGNVVANFGSGGTASLAAGSAMGYSGSWMVTQSQLESGKIQYSARYKFYNANGEQVSGSKPITGRITYQSAKPSVEIERILPASSIAEGQNAQVTYVFTNTGTVDVFNLTVSDPSLSGEILTCEKLGVGETMELIHNFTMGSSAVTTEATLSYDYAEGSSTKTSKATCKAVTFAVAKVDMLVKLTADTMVVNPGDTVTLTCVITNKGDLDYSQLRITDEKLGDLDSGISIEAGKSYTCKREITVTESGSYAFTVSGSDSFGAPVLFTSNSIAVQTAASPENKPVASFAPQAVESTSLLISDPAASSAPLTEGEIATPAPDATAEPIDLSITLEADREIIYTMPSDVVFTITVNNNGTNVLENLSLKTTGYYGTDIANIESLQPGESKVICRPFQASMGGQYQFSVSLKDSLGETQTFTSNTCGIVYQDLSTPTPRPTAKPTPVPTPTPEPTATPDLTPFEGENEEGSKSNLLTIILVAIFGVMILTVILLVILDQNKRGGGTPGGKGGKLGTLDLYTHRDYTEKSCSKKQSPKATAPGQESEGDAVETASHRRRTNRDAFVEENVQEFVPETRYARPSSSLADDSISDISPIDQPEIKKESAAYADAIEQVSDETLIMPKSILSTENRQAESTPVDARDFARKQRSQRSNNK